MRRLLFASMLLALVALPSIGGETIWGEGAAISGSQSSPSVGEVYSPFKVNITDPSNTSFGYGMGYGAANSFSSNPGNEADNFMGPYYNTLGVSLTNGAADVIDQFEHAWNRSWETSFRDTTATNDETWVEENWDLYPPNQSTVVTSPDAGFNPTVGTLLTFSGGGTGRVISWDGGTDTLTWRHDYGTTASGETITEVAGDGSDTATMGTITYTGVTDTWRPWQIVWNVLDNDVNIEWNTNPDAARPFFRLNDGAMGVNVDGSIGAESVAGPRFEVEGFNANTGQTRFKFDTSTSTNVTDTSLQGGRVIDVVSDFTGTGNTGLGTQMGIFIDPTDIGSGSSMSQYRAISVDDLHPGSGNLATTTYAMWISAQTPASQQGQHGLLFFEGGDWNNGHVAFAAASTGGDHVWMSQTNDVLMLATSSDDGGRPTSSTDGAQVLTGRATTADPCSSKPEGYAFYNDTSDYYCFCNGSGVDVQMHSPATACF